MQSFLESDLYGRTMGQWLYAIAFIAGGYLLGKIISFVSARILRRIAAKTRTKFDDIVLSIVEKPLIFIVFVAGVSLGIDSMNLEGDVAKTVDRIFYALVTFAVAWVIARVTDSVIQEYLVPLVEKSESTLDDQILPILRKGSKLLIWSVAILVGLKNAGYDVGALLAGLGIGGVAIALAAKDTLSNLFGSVTVFIDRPFSINDRIKVSGFDGTVTEIGMRSSRLKTLDNRTVTVPNAIFAASPIENVSSEPSTKVLQVIELSQENGSGAVERAIAILKEIAAGAEGLEGQAVAALSSFGESTIRLTFIVFIGKKADYFGTLSAINLEVLRRFREAGIEFAKPARLLPGR